MLPTEESQRSLLDKYSNSATGSKIMMRSITAISCYLSAVMNADTIQL